MSWKVGVGVAVVPTLGVATTILLGFNAYSMQVTVLALLVVAAVSILALLLLVAFVLFQEGIRLGFLWWTKRPNVRTKITPSIQLSNSSREGLSHLHR